MKRSIIILILFLLIFSRCTEETDIPYLYNREIGIKSMLSEDGELVFVSALPDTLTSKTTDAAEIYGEISYIDPNFSVLQYGHVWLEGKNNDSIPTLKNYSAYSSNGAMTVAHDFSTRITNAKANTDYYIRSYVLVQDLNSEAKIYGYNNGVLHFKTPDIQNTWKLVTSQYPGKERSDAISFVLGNKAYVGFGFDGANSLTDIWVYDGYSNGWYAGVAFPGEGRYGAVAFTLNNKAYIGFGVNNVGEYLRDFWQFDPNQGEAGVWTRMQDFPGFGRKYAIAFGVNDKGYIASGINGTSYREDVWEYDPLKNNWRDIQKPLSVTLQREKAVCFVLGDVAYMGLGNREGTNLSDFYMFNGLTQNWSSFAPFPGARRTGALAFSTPNGFYVGGGINDSSLIDFYRYDPFDDEWTEKAIIGDSTNYSIYQGVGFFVGEYGYFGTGFIDNKRSNRFWQYLP